MAWIASVRGAPSELEPGHPFGDGLGEGSDELAQLPLRHGAAGTGLDVVDGQSGLHLDERREIVARRAGVDVALDTGAGERRRQLAYVDVHPAAVAAARLLEGRRVHREDREFVHFSQRTGAVPATRTIVVQRSGPAHSRGE